jgi:hypothetical protein
MAEARDVSPDIADLLDDIEWESQRCLSYGARLSNWSMFWQVALIFIGAVVAAQGGALKAWGESGWLTSSFVLLGIFTAVGSGYQAFFKPGERSPKFAQMGLDYDVLHRETKRAADAATRAANVRDPLDIASLQDALATILQERYLQLAALRTREIALYVTGPVAVGRRPRHVGHKGPDRIVGS